MKSDATLIRVETDSGVTGIGAALVIEQTRMEQGVWLPRFAQLNLSL